MAPRWYGGFAVSSVASMRWLGLALIGALLCTARSASAKPDEAPQRVRVAVMPLHGINVPDYLPKALDEFLTVEVAKRGPYDVMSTSEIQTLLGLEEMKQAIGCDDTACLLEIGGALDVAYLISGKVSRLGEQINVSLALADVREARVLARVIESVADDESLLAGAVTAAVRRLFAHLDVGGVRAATPTVAAPAPVAFIKDAAAPSTSVDEPRWPRGTLLLQTDPTGLELSLDGKPVGKAPVTLKDVAAGSHELAVTQGWSTYRGSVQVSADEATLVRAQVQDHWFELLAGSGLSALSLPLLAVGAYCTLDNAGADTLLTDLGLPAGAATYVGVGGLLLGIGAATSGIPMMISAFGAEQLSIEEIEAP